MKKNVLLVALSSLFIVSCAELNTALDSVNKTLGSTLNTNSNMKVKNTSAKTICRDFKSNSLTAREKWFKSYVSLSGTIDSIGKTAWGNYSVDFKDGSSISIITIPERTVNLKSIRVGQKKKIRGIVRDVILAGTCNIFLERTNF
ncbi:tRNA_anti-like [Phocoenobacter uteri]|uniref:tRNA_anti-like n=1 Tax=Phocoenobacter uteri TaxID=146806 RepID=A0A379DEL2_9PAST|nr:hypothetical protein [Phocoenobacter uteri]MDG6882820.1 hypothetical protein [Phocoenobacter uteri]SUB76394.1 tRNA_anti-like [Phocoenobacter uteri]